ncbi:hypothetical protein C7120_03550 [Prevotella sp. oral taxon 376]|uniref:ArnT family glycosyltransferase n=1 Tax=Prevotella sp. oral taxon 376 TaxID=712466 RepID=UPI000D1E8A97|nr:glycosyltransferase family 39 protein [Prevotella sp. oral taxon 376]PTL34756.1 hypothetical protein C7120_03550 [Prevotella sp. oral taxon 376]
MQSSYRKLTILFFLFLVAILAIFGYTPTNDGAGYIEYAETCIETGEPYPCTNLIKGYPFIWNIGVVNLTALFLWIYHSVYPILLFFCLLKALTGLLIAKIAESIFNSKVALTAFILYILYPNNWGEVTMLNSETPMIFLALFAFYIILRNSENTRWLFLGGMLMALANWFRPIALIFLGSIILYYIFLERKNIIRKTTGILSGYILIIFLFGIESYSRTGYFIYQAESLWFNMAEATYETSVKPHYNTEMYPAGTARYIDNMKNKTAIECDKIWKKRSLDWLENNKLNYLSKVPGRLVYMYFNDIDNMTFLIKDKSKAENNYITLPYRNIVSQMNKLNGTQIAALICMLLYYIILLFAISGTITLLRKKHLKDAFLPLIIIIGGSLAIVLAIHGETRFKAPFMPFIFMLAAIALSEKTKLS